MQNNPSPKVAYDVDAEIERQEDLLKRTAKSRGNLYGPYLVRPVKPVLVVKHSHLAALGVSITLLLASAYGLFRLLFPNM